MAESAESLRLSGKVRGIVIAYGIGLFTILVPKGEPVLGSWTDAVTMVASGLALQGLLLLVRYLVGRYERAQGLEGELMPQAQHVTEVIVDGITVLLFALGTFRGIAGFIATDL